MYIYLHMIVIRDKAIIYIFFFKFQHLSISSVFYVRIGLEIWNTIAGFIFLTGPLSVKRVAVLSQTRWINFTYDKLIVNNFPVDQ